MTIEHPSSNLRFSRAWAMPHGDTFTVPPIGEFVQRYLAGSQISVDPFARNNRWATYRNDIDPETSAPYHMDAADFLAFLFEPWGMDLTDSVDLAILDPPYSPRQISELYRQMGRAANKEDTQNTALYARVRTALLPLLAPQATVLSFGWNSAGMGKGFELQEILLVNPWRCTQ
jgi:hypothetical protein